MAVKKNEGGIFKRLADLVSEDDAAPEAAAGTSVPTPVVPIVAPRTVTPVSTMPRGNVDAATLSAINETVAQQTPAVFTTFQQLLASFAFLTDDTQRYQAAITAMETTGKGSKAQLKAALAERVNALNKAQSMFESGLEEETRDTVGSKADQVARFDERIAQLEQDLAKTRESRDALQGEIDSSTVNLRETKKKFEIAFNAATQTITDENRMIATYLN